MHRKSIAKMTLAGFTAVAALLGAAWTAHAVNPDQGIYYYFTDTPRNASYGGVAPKRVNYNAVVNDFGFGMDTKSVVPSNVVHKFNMSMIGACLGSPGQAYNGSGQSHPLTSADDLLHWCPFGIRGDAMQAGLQISN